MNHMKRLRIVGLCLVATFGISASVASVAYAGEYGVCLKVAKNTGKWKDAGCEKEKVTGNYQWYSGRTGIGQPGVTTQDFEFTSTSGKATLTAKVGGKSYKIECIKGTDKGEVLGEQYNLDEITLEECFLVVGKERTECRYWTNSKRVENLPGIKFFADTYLLDHGTKGSSGLEPKEGEVWNAYFASEGYGFYEFPYMAEFDCAGVYFRISGQASGVVTPVSKMTSTWTVKFAKPTATKLNGEQDLISEYSFNGGATWERAAEPILTASIKYTTKDKSKIEIRDCNEKGAKSEGKGAQPCESEERVCFYAETAKVEPGRYLTEVACLKNEPAGGKEGRFYVGVE